MLSALFFAALQNRSKINIIDFGGSLGTTYYQNRIILKQAGIEFTWNVVEQGHFVKCGKEFFEDDELKFMYSIDEAINDNKNVCLLSGVLQYLETPYSILESIYNTNVEYIIIDRTSFTDGDKDVLTIQNVYEEIYEAKYPAWFFSLELFYEFIKERYEIIYQWDGFDYFELKGHKVYALGYLLKRKI